MARQVKSLNDLSEDNKSFSFFNVGSGTVISWWLTAHPTIRSAAARQPQTYEIQTDLNNNSITYSRFETCYRVDVLVSSHTEHTLSTSPPLKKKAIIQYIWLSLLNPRIRRAIWNQWSWKKNDHSHSDVNDWSLMATDSNSSHSKLLRESTCKRYHHNVKKHLGTLGPVTEETHPRLRLQAGFHVMPVDVPWQDEPKHMCGIDYSCKKTYTANMEPIRFRF